MLFVVQLLVAQLLFPLLLALPQTAVPPGSGLVIPSPDQTSVMADVSTGVGSYGWIIGVVVAVGIIFFIVGRAIRAGKKV